VPGAERSLDTRRCYLQCTGPPKGRVGCACGRRPCDEAAGSPMPRVHAPAGYGIGAALQITALVSGTGSILHDSPERSEVQSGARGVCLRATLTGSCAGLLAFAAGGRFPSAASLRVSAGPAMRVQPESVRAELRARSLAAVVSGRGGRAVLTSGRECAAPGRGLRAAGQAVRPSAEHGRPEVRLTFRQAPVCQLSARSNAESPGRPGRC
jgi:hypothetical protein